MDVPSGSPSSSRSSRSRSSSTTSTASTTPRTRSRPSSRPGCSLRARPSSGRRFSISSPRSRLAPRSPRPSAAGWSHLEYVTLAVIFAGLLRRDRLEPDHLVLRAADELVSRAVRRLCGRGRRQGRVPGDHPGGLDQDDRLHRPGADDRPDRGAGADDGDVLVVPLDAAQPRGRLVPPAAAASPPPRSA